MASLASCHLDLFPLLDNGEALGQKRKRNQVPQLTTIGRAAQGVYPLLPHNPPWPGRWGITCSSSKVLKRSLGTSNLVPGSSHLPRTLPVPFTFIVNKPPKETHNPPPQPRKVNIKSRKKVYLHHYKDEVCLLSLNNGLRKIFHKVCLRNPNSVLYIESE